MRTFACRSTLLYGYRLGYRKKTINVLGINCKYTEGEFNVYNLIQSTKHAPPPLSLTPLCSEAGVLDEPYSANPPQRSSHTGPPGWTRFQPT
jgi:hypothetical protein